ncbi:MAG: cyclic nucleotide-binding domain-containing protein [Cellvibrionaceae bacterium]
MSIIIKIARTPKELDDVYRLRFEVYVEERGKFAETIDGHPRVIDRFDALPGAVNIVAYHEGQAIASMRVNEDTEVGLPAEQYFDYSEVRQSIQNDYLNDNSGIRSEVPKLASGSMLAIHQNWRNRRSVIFAVFKMATGIMHTWGTTHVLCSISSETWSMYGRLGFERLSESEWKESVADDMLPIMAPFKKVFDWSFGEIRKTINNFWLDNFCGQFERIILSPGEVLFNQNDKANHTFAVDEGWIAISREDPEGNEMVLANLSRGSLFGEVAVFDGERRSAKAVALANTELIAIERSHMFEMLKKNPENMAQLLKHFATLVRDSGNMAMVQAFAHQTGRVDFALKELWRSADPETPGSSLRSIKVGPSQLAKTARVREEDVRQVLELKKAQGVLDYGNRIIKFLEEPEEDSMGSQFRQSPL